MRGFSEAEFTARVERARVLMTKEKLDGILVTSEPNLEYLSGFTTQFAWSSPSRPWYFVLPRTGDATAVIPEIGETNWLATSWCKRIMTWPSPVPENEGLDLLAAAIAAIKRRFGRFGVELGQETRLGMAPGDLLRLRDAIRPLEIADCVPVMRELRLIKSAAEIAHIRHICRIACDGFDGLPSLLELGDSEKTICRKFAADLLLRGADKVPYTSIGTGKGGYSSIIMGPTERKLRKGDILLIDTGAKYAGYFCDFDRNIAIGAPPDAAKRVQDVLWRATAAGIAAAVPGNRAADLFYAQARVLEDAGIAIGNVGRFGHGLGKVMTEFPSNKPIDKTELRPGMVLTIEPSAMFGDGKILVHEENVVVTETGPQLLTRRAPREMVVADLA
ncbi:MAG: aminopeptidase P family protein [Alphaproteobacteria bacterium]|nr:aminopeptidase P family protein [Alphaproteobacteria bacterium]